MRGFREARLGPAERAESLDGVLGGGAGAPHLVDEKGEALGRADVHPMLAHELLEIVDDDAIGQRSGIEVLAGHLHQQAFAGVVVEAEGTVPLVGEQLLHGDVVVHAEVAPA